MVMIDVTKCNFSIVKCVTSGLGYREGFYYAQIGWNNGVGIQNIDGQGNCITRIFEDGGVGKGDINNFDGSGCPSFIYVNEALICETEEKY